MVNELRAHGRTLQFDERVSTELQAQLFEHWREAANDVETEVPQWLAVGAPAGILHHARTVGVFPEVANKDKYPRPLASYGENFHDYASVEEDEAAVDEVEKLTYTR